jgi:hypothetical protein
VAVKKIVSATVLGLALLLGSTASARADYYTYVPRTVYVTRYDCYGYPYRVAVTVYVRVLVRTGCGY